MKKAVFLDRDGVINKEVGDYVYKVSDFIINKGVFEALKLLQDAGYLLIIITNQGGIAKNIYTKQDVDKVHGFLNSELQKHNIKLTEIYYCPHHSEVNNICLCRKPNSIMIEKAIARFNIDANKSYMIGDKNRDVEVGKKAGVKTIKISSNENILEICKKIISDAN